MQVRVQRGKALAVLVRNKMKINYKQTTKKNRENPLPNHIDHSVELRVNHHDKGNGLPQSIAGYDPHLLQPMLIQCVPQQLGKKKESKEQREGTNKKNGFQIVKTLYWERQHLLQHQLKNLLCICSCFCNLDNCYTK